MIKGHRQSQTKAQIYRAVEPGPMANTTQT